MRLMIHRQNKTAWKIILSGFYCIRAAVWILFHARNKNRPNLMEVRADYYSFSISVMILSSETVCGSNTTFPVSVLMEYILLSNTFLKKLMELFNIIAITFLYFLWHILFWRYLVSQTFNIVLISTSALYK